MVPGLKVAGPASGGVDVLERDETVLVDCSGDGNGATTPVPVLVGLSTGGADVLERDVVVDGLVDAGGLEVLGVFGGVVDDDAIPPPAACGVEEAPNPPATPGPPPTQT